MEISDKLAELKGVPTIEELLDRLKKEILTVTFLKLDGDQRVMDCTKSFDVIPKEHHPKTDSLALDESVDKQPRVGTVTVWDINAKGWRSFKYDRVQAVSNTSIQIII